MYGRRGFVQWQYVVPDEAADVRASSRRAALSSAGVSSFLAVLKRFGPGDDAPLSFPTEGWTLALDIPVDGPAWSRSSTSSTRRSSSRAVGSTWRRTAGCGPSCCRSMYPRLDEWRAVREQVDPEQRFRSDMSRRLRLF